MLQQSIKVSLIALNFGQLIYLLLTSCCHGLLPLLPIKPLETLLSQLEVRTILTKAGAV